MNLVSPGRCATNGPATTHVRLYSAGRGPGVHNQDHPSFFWFPPTSAPKKFWRRGHRVIVVIIKQKVAVKLDLERSVCSTP